MEIRELRNYSQEQFEDLKQLMSELSERVAFTQIDLMKVLHDSNSHLYAMFDGEHIIGCATLCVFHSPTGTKASVEDVVVSSSYRGQHLGKKLKEYVLDEAKKLAPIELHLTSNPKRVAANKLYQSLGFQKHETNCYQMAITNAGSPVADIDALKQNITYLIGKELAEGNQESLSAECISQILNVSLVDVKLAMASLR